MESSLQTSAVCLSIGSFLPIRWHCLLHQKPLLFSPGMVVALELEDPADEWETNNQLKEQKDADAPVYIYVRIVERLQLHISTDDHSSQGSEENPLTARYRVDLGKDGYTVVLGAVLYSFNPCLSMLLPQHADTQIHEGLKVQPLPSCSSVIFDVESVSYETIVGEIKKAIFEAEAEANTDDQNPIARHLAKRVYLHWHPDKNNKDGENLEICCQVCSVRAQIFHEIRIVSSLTRATNLYERFSLFGFRKVA